MIEKFDSEEYDWVDLYNLVEDSHNKTKSIILNKMNSLNIHIARYPIVVFLFSAICCLSFSAVFHLFYAMGRKTNKILLRLDYAGINILITGSCFPPFVYGFYCQPNYYYVYLGIVGSVSLLVFFVSLTDTLHKGIMYASLGIFAGFPIFHLASNELNIAENSSYLSFSSSLPFYFLMGGLYLGGLVIYIAQCPERIRPGKFDICGHSHQLWHCSVLLAIFVAYLGSLEVFYARKMTHC